MENAMNHEHDHPQKGRHAHACGSNATAAQVTDPVCCMKVDPKSSVGSHGYNGTTYYFCSKHCLKQFKTDPANYVHPSLTSAAVVPAESSQYTCPMHPEIVRDEPGSCPKCGMALVQIASTGSTGNSELRDFTRHRVSTATLSRDHAHIKQNLVFALGFPLAAGVLYPAFGLLLSPLVTAAAIALSSVSVVTNALRFNKVKL